MVIGSAKERVVELENPFEKAEENRQQEEARLPTKAGVEVVERQHVDSHYFSRMFITIITGSKEDGED